MSTKLATSLVKTEPTLKLIESYDDCYCLKARNMSDLDVQCFSCAKWFHKSCIEVETGPLVRFMVNYQFVCKKCSPTRTETFVKKQASFHQLCLTALANLTAESLNNDDRPKQFFSKDKEIIPFIDKNWDAMTSVARRSKPTWHATISRSMTREDVFKTKSESRTSEPLYGLKETALEKIGKNFIQSKCAKRFKIL
jgi:Set1/Ash2 histone methyltransferase complex subunit ASH2